MRSECKIDRNYGNSYYDNNNKKLLDVWARAHCSVLTKANAVLMNFICSQFAQET